LVGAVNTSAIGVTLKEGEKENGRGLKANDTNKMEGVEEMVAG